MPDQSAIALLLQGLSPDEQQELADIVTYLGEKAGPGNPSGMMAEGSIASLLNRASPKVREKFMRLSEVLEVPRHLPFQPKRSEGQIAEDFGLDGATSETVKSALDGQHVAAGLQRRMGTDSQLPDREPTLRELLLAAHDSAPTRLHPSGDNFLPEMSNAAEGISRREAIKRIMETKEQFK